MPDIIVAEGLNSFPHTPKFPIQFFYNSLLLALAYNNTPLRCSLDEFSDAFVTTMKKFYSSQYKCLLPEVDLSEVDPIFGHSPHALAMIHQGQNDYLFTWESTGTDIMNDFEKGTYALARERFSSLGKHAFPAPQRLALLYIAREISLKLKEIS